MFNRREAIIRNSAGASIIQAEQIVIEQTPVELLRLLKEEVERLDAQIREKIPTVIDPRRNDEEVPFESAHLLRSLLSIDVPIDVAIFVVRQLPAAIPTPAADQPPITINDLRVAVAEQLFRLGAHEGVTRDQAGRWGDAYVRAFGTPHREGPVVLMRDREVRLTHQFVRDQVLPLMIEQVLRLHPELIRPPLISGEEQERMAQVVMDAVRGLRLYSIRLEALMTIARELAVQPPHPWLVEEAFSNATWKYDLERAERHASAINNVDPIESPAEAFHLAEQCARHAASALLAFYGGYLGAGVFSPVSSLRRAADLPRDGGKEVLWRFCRLRHVAGDLQGIGQSYKAVVHLCEQLEQLHGERALATESLREFLEKALKLESIARALIFNRQALDGLPTVTAEGATWQVRVREFFLRLKGWRLSAQQPTDPALFVVEHPWSAGIFKKIDPEIVVLCVDAATDFKKSTEIAVAEIMKRAFATNSVIVVVHHDDGMTHREELRSRLSSSQVPFVVSSSALFKTADAQWREEAFDSLLREARVV